MSFAYAKPALHLQTLASNLEKAKKAKNTAWPDDDHIDGDGQAPAAGAVEATENGDAPAAGAGGVVRDTTPQELEEVPRKALEVSMGLHKLITLVLSPIYARAGLDLKPVSAHNAVPRLMLFLVTPPGQDLVNALALRGVEGAFGDGNKLTAAGATAVAKACAAGLMMAGLGNSTHLFNVGGSLTPGKLELLVKSINEDKLGIASKLNLSESEIDRAKRAGLGLLMLQVAFARDKWLECQQHQDIYDSWATDNPRILPVIQSGTTVPDAAVRYIANRYPFLQLPAAQAEFGPFLSLAVLKAHVGALHGSAKATIQVVDVLATTGQEAEIQDAVREVPEQPSGAANMVSGDKDRSRRNLRRTGADTSTDLHRTGADNVTDPLHSNAAGSIRSNLPSSAVYAAAGAADKDRPSQPTSAALFYKAPQQRATKVITNAVKDENGQVQFGFEDDSEPGSLKLLRGEEVDLRNDENLQRVIMLQTAIYMGHENVVIADDGEVYSVRVNGKQLTHEKLDIWTKYGTVADSIFERFKTVVYDGTLYSLSSADGRNEPHDRNVGKRSRSDDDKSEEEDEDVSEDSEEEDVSEDDPIADDARAGTQPDDNMVTDQVTTRKETVGNAGGNSERTEPRRRIPKQPVAKAQNTPTVKTYGTRNAKNTAKAQDTSNISSRSTPKTKARGNRDAKDAAKGKDAPKVGATARAGAKRLKK